MMSQVFCSFLLAASMTIAASAETTPPKPKAQPPAVTDSARKKFFIALDKKQFYRSGSCADFANTILNKAGLPSLGTTTPVKGTRGKSDLAGANGERPTFSDSVTSLGEPSMEYRVSAQADAPDDQWTLTLNRTRKSKGIAELVTQSKYLMQLHEGRKVCDVMSFSFGFLTGAKASGTPELKEMSATQCADNFLLTPNVPSDRSPADKKDGFAWLRDDCATSLHYSADAKSRARL